MKIYTLVLLSALLGLMGCSLLFSSPSSVVKALTSAAEADNIDGMVGLWGSKAGQEQGVDKIRKDAQNFSELVTKIRAAGKSPKVENMRETVNGDRSRVFFIYRASPTDSVGMGFALLKEDGKWKLYRAIDISEEEQPFESSFAEKNSPGPDVTPEPNINLVPPPPPPSSVNQNTKTAPVASTNTSPISGGVLNGKAVTLPKPATPPVAKAAKASGTVVVQVTVDESGNVISAKAVSGHPLLRPAAESAARYARFKPTLLEGKAVKVNGTLTYEFSPE